MMLPARDECIPSEYLPRSQDEVAIGTLRTSGDVRCAVANGAEADIGVDGRTVSENLRTTLTRSEFPLST